MTHVFLTRYYL
jgi:Tfp pilus assembly protein PilE